MNHIVGGGFLVAGTCIGAGMLGLPVQTGPAGFTATTLLFIVCWALMLFTALCMLEATLYCSGETNLISMMRRTLGKKGGVFAWIVYVLFFYSLMAAYLSGGSAIITEALRRFIPDLPYAVGTTGYVGVFALVVAYGAVWVDWLNRFLMLGLILSYGLLIYFIAPVVDTSYLSQGNPSTLISALPLIVTTFGFHLLIPSLKLYLDEKPSHLRLAIVLGSVLSLLIYVMWILLIMGMIPVDGLNGLGSLGQAGDPNVRLVQMLDLKFHSPLLTSAIQCFTLFALLSSVIGVSLSLFDFFADALHLSRKGSGKLKLGFLTFGFPALFAYFFPEGFLIALRYAGVFAAILLILFPILMVWVGRYHLKLIGPYQVMGGKFLLILGALFGFAVIGSMFY